MSMGYMPGMAGKSFGSGSFGSGSTNAATNSANNNIGQVYQDMGQNYQRFGQAYQQATQAANQLRSASTTQQQQMNQYLQALQTALGGMSTAGQNTTNQQPISGGLPQGFKPDHGLQPKPDQFPNVNVYGFTGFEDNPARFNAGQTLGATGEQGLNAGQQNAYPLSQDQIAQLRARGLSPSDMFINGATYNDLINGTGQSAWPGINANQQNMINAQQQFFTGTIAPAYQQAVEGARGIYGSPSMNPQDFYNQYSSVIFGDQASAYTPNFQG